MTESGKTLKVRDGEKGGIRWKTETLEQWKKVIRRIRHFGLICLIKKSTYLPIVTYVDVRL
mgnify:CR=1 FL=1